MKVRDFFIVLLVSLSLMGMNGKTKLIANQLEDKPKVYYVYDPLCGWCYGFSDYILQLQSTYKDKADFYLIPAGMVIGKRERPLADYANFFPASVDEIEYTSPKKFDTLYKDKEALKNSSYIVSSMKPSVSVAVFYTIDSSRIFEYSSNLQTAIFGEGKDLSLDETYEAILTKMNVKDSLFTLKMEDSLYIKRAEKMFQNALTLGIISYPTVLIHKDGKIKTVTDGYVAYEYLEKRFLKLLK